MLNYKQIAELFDSELSNAIRANKSYEVVQKERTVAIDIFNQLQREQKYRNVHKEEYSILMGAVIEDLKLGMYAVDIKEELADISGLTYYDNFLGKGERRNIINALKEHDIPVDVLSVVTKEIANREWIIPNGKIIQHVESEHGRSPHIVYFAIIVNNEVVYEFGNQRNDLYKKEDDQTWYDFFEDTLPQSVDALGKRKTKSVYAGTIVKDDGTVYTRWVNSKDKFFVRRVK